MRLGEIQKILGASIDENHKLVLKQESTFGGQAFRVNNYIEIISALDMLTNQKWSTSDYTQIENIKAQHSELVNPVVLTTNEFNQLNSYVNTLNQKIPIFWSFLNSFTEGQDEKTINIQLPTNIESLEKLNELNNRLIDIFKRYNIDGEIIFQGFDTGTSWYVLLIKGVVTYQTIIACLKIAQEYFKTKTEYFNSKEARIAYLTALNKDKESKDNLNQFKDAFLENLLKEGVMEVVNKLGETHGFTKSELNTRLIQATTKLIKELGYGTEFHLSLNPPPYAEEQGGELKINYLAMQQALPKLKTKQLSAGKKRQIRKNNKKPNIEPLTTS
ncbi:MAG: hypothetical protein HYW15_00800 [Candidatus Giovannonibacteria bacterium]|nr:MAG: hypothetical protein HYW15_00800 [Candidatus Giovannonibacteria bacterium]